MNPAFSVITFTTVAGAAQGLVVALACGVLGAVPVSARFGCVALGLALVMLAVGLGASFLHLGHPMRAWRAMAMWRTSWLSREVIVMPVFMGVVGLWWLAVCQGASGGQGAWALVCIGLAALLWLCTAQIYACLRFIQEWAHPLTLVNYTLIGLASGTVLAGALAACMGERAFLAAASPWALALTFLAWAGRTAALLRNQGLKARSTAQSATGIQAPRLVQKSMGMSAGAFNTREFFHRATQATVHRIRWAVHGLGFALPLTLLLVARRAETPSLLWWGAVASMVPGLLAERWLFFAQARHPQNLYYQAVS